MSDKRYSTPVNDVVEKEKGATRPATVALHQPISRERSSRIRIVGGSNTLPRPKRDRETLDTLQIRHASRDDISRDTLTTVPSVSFADPSNGREEEKEEKGKGEGKSENMRSSIKSKNLLVDENEYPQKVYDRETLRQRYQSESYYTDQEDSSDDEENDDRHVRSVWRTLAQIFTCCFPERCVPGKTRDQRQAWREKVAINCLIYLFSALLLFLFGVLPLLICPDDDIYTFRDINAQRNEAWIVVHGEIFDMADYFDRHPGGLDPLRDYLGQDASLFFKRPEINSVDSICLNPMSSYLANGTTQECESERVLGDVDFQFRHCHTITNEDSVLADLKTGDLAYTYPDLEEPTAGQWVIIFDRIYNVTEYISKGQDYLNENLDAVIKNKLKEDATEVYEELYPQNETLSCLDSLFNAGVLDNRFSLECAILNWFILISVAIVAFVMLAKFFTSLISLGTKGYRERKKFVIINIPCYTEDKESLSKTINSVTCMDYSDAHKLLFIVCDGNLKGSGQKRTTPETVMAILGNSLNNETATFTYSSLGKGAKAQNLVRVYSGRYKYQRNSKEEVHEVPYIVVVKIGFAHEVADRPGNRGKRDSQLILFNFLSKMFYIDQGVTTKTFKLTKLDEELMKRFNELGNEVSKYEFMLTVDSDTEVKEDSLRKMIAHMNNKKIIALCGLTKVGNPWDSWVTSIQVYEYYINHHLHKAFESLFGSVTCLPGCFSLYRLKFKGVHRDTPALLNKEVLREYSSNTVDTLHKRNLLELGEDRYLTSLLLKNYPEKKLVFTPDAECSTIVPSTWKVLRSQRRRWINSTIHNLFELATFSELRGICCFSMRFIVILDLISSFTLPASIVYLGYLFYLFIVETSMVSSLILIVLIIIYATQFLLFMFKRQYEYLFWMTLYVISIPIWWFVLPILSYWKMDEFSWGKTRKVEKAKLKTNGDSGSKYVNKSTEREAIV